MLLTLEEMDNEEQKKEATGKSCCTSDFSGRWDYRGYFGLDYDDDDSYYTAGTGVERDHFGFPYRRDMRGS